MHENYGFVWLYCLNNSFRYLNNRIRISTTLFYSHIFSQHLNNVNRTILSNGPYNIGRCMDSKISVEFCSDRKGGPFFNN